MSKIDIPVYCINLKRSNKRKKIMRQQFMSHNIQYKFINAIDGNNVTNTKEGKVQGIKYKNISILSEKYIKGTGGTLKYCMACFFSHVKAIKQAYDDKCKACIIMEDDISFKYMNRWR